MFRKLLAYLLRLHWGYKVALAASLVLVGFLIYKLALLLFPTFFVISALIFISTDGEIFTILWEKLKQSSLGYEANPTLEENYYNWLTEQGVVELPISTIQFLQGVERYSKNGVYYIHLNEEISIDSLDTFAMKARQQMKLLSFGHYDCVIALVRREPFLSVKVRIIKSSDVELQNTVTKEDF